MPNRTSNTIREDLQSHAEILLSDFNAGIPVWGTKTVASRSFPPSGKTQILRAYANQHLIRVGVK